MYILGRKACSHRNNLYWLRFILILFVHSYKSIIFMVSSWSVTNLSRKLKLLGYDEEALYLRFASYRCDMDHNGPLKTVRNRWYHHLLFTMPSTLFMAFYNMTPYLVVCEEPWATDNDVTKVSMPQAIVRQQCFWPDLMTSTNSLPALQQSSCLILRSMSGPTNDITPLT